MKHLILFSILLGFVITPVFAEITINTNQDTFSGGDTVLLTGNVEGANEGDFVAIEVKDPAGDTILIRTVSVDADGNYRLEFKTPKSSETGSYEIIANADVEGKTETKTMTVSQTDSQGQTESQTSEGGGCLIATAAYGSELSPQIQQLREIRDNKLLQTESGSVFIKSFNDFYYSFSPTIADYERENPVFKETVKLAITPMISSLSILNYVDMDSEHEVLGYGISLLLLNIGMYFSPAIIIIKLRK